MRKQKPGIIIGSLTTIIIVGLIAVFAFQYFTKTGVFHQPGTIIFADNVPESERTLINGIMENQPDVELENDVTISAQTLTELEISDSQLLYNILVPTTDFYNPLTSVGADEVPTYALTPILELTPQQKLLALDGEYYLDTLNSGAFFKYLNLTGDHHDVQKIADLIQPQLPTFPSKDTVLTFAQTGVTALSRGMNAKLKQVGDAKYFAANIANFLSQFDLTHTSNEASFTVLAADRNICSAPQMIDVLTTIGLDIVELTGNHNQDCGDEAALETIAKYAELGIKTVGGGATAELAAAPLNIDQKGNHITMLAYNLSTGGYTLDNTPGANFYTTEKAKADIAAAKERGDTVIVDVQYFECNNYDNATDDRTCDYANSAAGDQIGLFREIIDLGADVVVGTAAHQPQTYELYGDGAIYYGLGNLFFDQIWWPGTTRSLILVHYFLNDHLVQTRIVPTIYDTSMQTQLMDTADAESFINRLNQARP